MKALCVATKVISLNSFVTFAFIGSEIYSTSYFFNGNHMVTRVKLMKLELVELERREGRPELSYRNVTIQHLLLVEMYLCLDNHTMKKKLFMNNFYIEI